MARIETDAQNAQTNLHRQSNNLTKMTFSKWQEIL